MAGILAENDQDKNKEPKKEKVCKDTEKLKCIVCGAFAINKCPHCEKWVCYTHLEEHVLECEAEKLEKGDLKHFAVEVEVKGKRIFTVLGRTDEEALENGKKIASYNLKNQGFNIDMISVKPTKGELE